MTVCESLSGNENKDSSECMFNDNLLIFNDCMCCSNWLISDDYM